MARLIVQQQSTARIPLRLHDLDVTAVDRRGDRYQIELQGDGRAVILQFSQREMVALSAVLRHEIGKTEEREQWQGYVVGPVPSRVSQTPNSDRRRSPR